MNAYVEICLSMVFGVALVGVIIAPLCAIDVVLRLKLGHVQKIRYFEFTDRVDSFIESRAFAGALYVFVVTAAALFFICLKTGRLHGFLKWLLTLY